MLDLDFITANPEAVRRAIEVKGVDLDLDELLRAYESLKATLQEVEARRAERNRPSKPTGSAASEERQRFIDRSRQIGVRLGELEPGLREKERHLRELLLRVPNIPADDEPVGEGEEQNVEHHAWGERPEFSFRPRDHVELVELNDWADLARSGKIAGPRTYTLKGALVQIEMAIWQMAIDLLRGRGFTVISVPSLVKEEALIGTGHFPSAVEGLLLNEGGHGD